MCFVFRNEFLVCCASRMCSSALQFLLRLQIAIRSFVFSFFRSLCLFDCRWCRCFRITSVCTFRSCAHASVCVCVWLRECNSERHIETGTNVALVNEISKWSWLKAKTERKQNTKFLQSAQSYSIYRVFSFVLVLLSFLLFFSSHTRRGSARNARCVCKSMRLKIVCSIFGGRNWNGYLLNVRWHFNHYRCWHKMNEQRIAMKLARVCVFLIAFC